MHFDADTKKQAGELYQLFKESFGPTKAFRQAISYICKLLEGKHPALQGRVFSRDELELSIHKAEGQNTHDARNFFGPEALFNQYLTGENKPQEGMDMTEKLYHSTSKIINLYLQEVNPKCNEDDKLIVRQFLELMMTDPRVLGHKNRFTMKEILNAVKSYSLVKIGVEEKYRHHIINFFVNKRVVDNYLPKSKMPSGRLCFLSWGVS